MAAPGRDAGAHQEEQVGLAGAIQLGTKTEVPVRLKRIICAECYLLLHAAVATATVR